MSNKSISNAFSTLLLKKRAKLTKFMFELSLMRYQCRCFSNVMSRQIEQSYLYVNRQFFFHTYLSGINVCVSRKLELNPMNCYH